MSQAVGLAGQQQLDALEDRVTRRIADSIESLGEIIQSMAKKQKTFNDRLIFLENNKQKVTEKRSTSNK
jgi:hypothetical protein